MTGTCSMDILIKLGRWLLALTVALLHSGCTLTQNAIPGRGVASVKVGGIIGAPKQPLAKLNADIKEIVLEMKPVLEARGFMLTEGEQAAVARWGKGIGYQANYELRRDRTNGSFQCNIDADRERIEVEFIEYAAVSRKFDKTTEEREFIYETARLVRDHLQAKFPGRKVQVSFTNYE